MKMQMGSRPARRFRQEIDTNVFRIGFKTLLDEAELATGDPIICAKCNAIFNKFSKVEELQGQQLWKCEFCNHKNDVDIEEGEEPTKTAVNYLLQAAAQRKQDKLALNQDISVVFCVDQSGSMCCS